MISVLSKNNHIVRITDERLNHIFSNHPETKNSITSIIETLEEPDFIFRGDFGELLAIKLYSKTPITQNKYLVVVYKEVGERNGFILTAYYCSKYNSNRQLLWKR